MKRDVRQAILEAGGKLIHRQGFHKTGLKEILDAAGVPKGSFYFYFKSKEEFGLALVDHYAAAGAEATKSLLEDRKTPPLERLRRFFVQSREAFRATGCTRGCPIGNMAQEMSDLSPAMRERIRAGLDALAGRLTLVLEEARERGEMRPGLDPAETAAFLLDAWEGALMRMKVAKDTDPLTRFEDIAFRHLLT